MEEIKRGLDEVIKEEIRNLAYFESGSKEKSIAIDDLVKLYKLKIEDDRCKNETFDKQDASLMRELEQSLKKEQLHEQIVDRYFRLGMDLAILILPLMFYGKWMKKGLEFEETGAFTSTTFRGLISNFRPIKR